jgi:hypothetical protein
MMTGWVGLSRFLAPYPRCASNAMDWRFCITGKGLPYDFMIGSWRWCILISDEECAYMVVFSKYSVRARNERVLF